MYFETVVLFLIIILLQGARKEGGTGEREDHLPVRLCSECGSAGPRRLCGVGGPGWGGGTCAHHQAEARAVRADRCRRPVTDQALRLLIALVRVQWAQAQAYDVCSPREARASCT